jgi:hypothetical protein
MRRTRNLLLKLPRPRRHQGGITPVIDHGVSFCYAGIGEGNPPVPEGPFPLSQSSRAQGLQQVGQRPVQRTVKRKLVEAIVPQAREE